MPGDLCPPHSRGGGGEGGGGGRAGRAARDADSPAPDLVDLGGNYKAVTGQAASDLGPEVGPKRAVGEVEVGVMGFSLGDRGDAVDELNPWHEALEPESASELEVAFDVRNAPTLQLVEQAVDLGGGQVWRARPADHAVALGQRASHRPIVVGLGRMRPPMGG